MAYDKITPPKEGSKITVKADGTLAPLSGSPFLTGGSGVANPTEALGPDDSDNPIVISSDGQYLMAVNGGSNTIAVFSINPNGSLTAVNGTDDEPWLIWLNGGPGASRCAYLTIIGPSPC